MDTDVSAAKQSQGNDNEPSTLTMATSLLARAQVLVNEIEMFRDRMRELGRKEPGVATFLKTAHNEATQLHTCLNTIRALESKSAGLTRDNSHDGAANGRNEDEEKIIRYQLESSNLPGLEAKWGVIKRCRGLVAMSSSFLFKGSGSKGKKLRLTGQNSVLVDAVVDGGLEWVRVCNDNERRIEYQMAQSGWGFDDGEPRISAACDGEGDLVVDGDDEDESIFVLKTARHLVQAARLARFRYRTPRVHIVMTRVREGRDKSINDLLRTLRGLGGDDVVVVVDCATSNFLEIDRSFDAALQSLLTADETGELTDSLNLDCSILLALASDITHSRVETQDWQNEQLRRDIRKENADPGMLFRIVRGTLGPRRLVTAWDTASHFFTIVYQLGTMTEKKRAHILMPPGFVEQWFAAFPECSRRQPAGLEMSRRKEVHPAAELQGHSIHRIPADLRVPVAVIGGPNAWAMDVVEDHIRDGWMPFVAKAVGNGLKQPNLSTFMLGWMSGQTTYTSNGDLARKIERLVEENRTSGKEAGPKVAVCKLSRSLVGTPKLLQGQLLPVPGSS